MNEQLKRYYLEQMGIETWVRRNLPPPPPLLNIIAPNSPKTLVMIVLEGAEIDKTKHWLAGKVGQLLKKMLHSIGVTTDNTAILCGLTSTPDSDHQQRDVELKEQIVRLKPQLILLLGQFSTQFLQDKGNHAPLITSMHPTDLLKNPSKKKQVFCDLMAIKKVLGS